MSGEPTRITERDRLALLGGIEVIRIYQRMIEETTTIIARILQVEPDPGYGAANYYGVLSDEVIDDRHGGQAAAPLRGRGHPRRVRGPRSAPGA
jgi:hypothetical protein